MCSKWRKIITFLTCMSQYYWIQAAYVITWAEGRAIGAQGKGLLFLKYLCVCRGKRKYCMGLDAAGYDRIYALAKGRIENTGGRTPLSVESIFLIYHRQLFFDIAALRGEYRHVWLTAHVLNVVVYHRY